MNAAAATNTARVETISVDIDDAIELSELLEFVSDWLTNAPGVVADDLERFVGLDRYSMAELASTLIGWSNRLLTTRIEPAR